MTVQKTTITDIARCLNRDHKQGTEMPPAFFITDQDAVPHPEDVIARLPQGFGVIFRDYSHPERADFGRHLRAACLNRGLIFLVAADHALAEKLKADGVHLPEHMMMKSADIRAQHPHWIITAACHSKAALQQAETLPIDAGLISPVFKTLSHPEIVTEDQGVLGVSGVLDMTSRCHLPLYGLGGITNANASMLLPSGLAGLAAIRGFLEE